MRNLILIICMLVGLAANAQKIYQNTFYHNEMNLHNSEGAVVKTIEDNGEIVATISDLNKVSIRFPSIKNSVIDMDFIRKNDDGSLLYKTSDKYCSMLVYSDIIYFKFGEELYSYSISGYKEEVIYSELEKSKI